MLPLRGAPLDTAHAAEESVDVTVDSGRPFLSKRAHRGEQTRFGCCKIKENLQKIKFWLWFWKN